MTRAIGRWSLIALIVNFTIGAGIFGLPSAVAGLLGTSSPIAYLITAAGIGVIAACVAEVASRFRQTGGPFVYARTAFGSFVGLQIGWLMWLTRVTSAAAVASIFADYLSAFWPQAAGPFNRFLVLTILIGGLAFLNFRGINLGTFTNNVLTMAKLLPLLILIIGGLVYLGIHGSRIQASHQPQPIGTWLSAVLLLVYVFAGFESALIPAGEFKNPGRDIATALLIALTLVTTVYLLVQIVVIFLVPNAAESSHPLSSAAFVIGGNRMAMVVSLGALLSSLGNLAANMISTPRLTYAFAEQGYFPQWFCAVHARYRTPHTSILAFAILLWILAFVGTFRWNAMLSALSRLLVYSITCAALPVLRNKQVAPEGFHLRAGTPLTIGGIIFVCGLVSRMGRAELVVLAATATLALLNWWAVRRKASLCQHSGE